MLQKRDEWGYSEEAGTTRGCERGPSFYLGSKVRHGLQLHSQQPCVCSCLGPQRGFYRHSDCDERRRADTILICVAVNV